MYGKYHLYKKQLSWDSGVTWYDVDPLETVISGNPVAIYDTLEECGTRWAIVSDGYECSGTTKMTQEKKQIWDSVEGWIDVIPLETRAVLPVIEYNSEDCGYEPTYEFLYRVYQKFSDGTSRTLTGGCGSSIPAYVTYQCRSLVEPQGGDWATRTAEIGCATDLHPSYYAEHGVVQGTLGTFQDCKELTSVTLSNKVKVIGDKAFSGCLKLRNLNIPRRLTTIGDYAFNACQSLPNITIPNTVTSIGKYAFAGCYFTNITIPSSITSISEGLFQTNLALTSVTIPNTVASIGDYAFKNCSALRSIGPVGSGASIEIPSSVTSIGNSAFQDCPGLTSVTIPDTVTSIGDYIFQLCGSLTSCTIGSGVTSIGVEAFRSCYDLPNITIPDNITSIGQSAFYYCSSLTGCTIGSGVTQIGDTAFFDCGLTSINIPDNVLTVGNDVFKQCHGLTNATIGNGLTEIGDGMFCYCNSLTAATIGSGVTRIGYSSFYACSGLTTITIPSSVTSIGKQAFSNCSGLTAITIDATTPPDLEHAYVFDNTNNCPIYVPCTSVNAYKNSPRWYAYGLTSRITCKPTPGVDKCILTLNNSDLVNIECDGTGVISDGEIAPYRETLVRAEIADGCVGAISDWTFSGCTNLSSVTISNTLLSIGGNAFRDCTALTSFNIPDNVTGLGGSAFICCSGLTNVTIGNGVTGIINFAFGYCTGLTSITIGSGVTQIGDNVFRDCISLSSITIPESVTTIKYQAFYGCTSLSSVTINATTPPTFVADYYGNYQIFDNTPIASGTGVIYVPCDSLEAYKTANGWSDYTNIIQGIPPCTIYRWTQSGTTCVGYDKYQNNIKEQSTDGGEHWSAVIPAEYSTSYLVETFSVDCGYAPPAPFEGKYQLILDDSSVVTADCDSTSAITSIGSVPLGSVINARIGNCVTSIGTNAFRDCVNLTSVTLSDTVITLGNNAFYHCSGLTNVKMESVKTIGYACFNGCNNLTGITIPNSVTSIDAAAFGGYKSTSIKIPDSVTSIGYDAFRGLANLSIVEIGSGITNISSSVFRDCTGLTSVTIYATTPPTLRGWVFDNTNDCPIYVPRESVNAYKTANGWNSYRNRIQAIP